MVIKNLGDIAVIKLVEPLLNDTIAIKDRITKKISYNNKAFGLRRLDKFLRKKRPFSFLRLGDREAALLIVEQSDKFKINWGPPGLSRVAVKRLRKAYATASYVDFGQRIWMMKGLIPSIDLQRPPKALSNLNEKDSHIFTDWFRFKLKKYVKKPRICLFVGAEANLLKELLNEKQYVKICKKIFPCSPNLYFYNVYSTHFSHLKHIKKQISKLIRFYHIDTVFICLGASAKILCQELAQEHNICAFDAGSIMRALTFSGSDGNNPKVSDHHPFLVHVPFKLYMKSLIRAYPSISNELLLRKAQAQVLRELCKQNKGESSASITSFKNVSCARVLKFENVLTEYFHDYKYLRFKNIKCFLTWFKFKIKIIYMKNNHYFIFRKINQLKQKLF